MELVLPETRTDDDAEFDLDVRVQAVARKPWAEAGEKPYPITYLCTQTACGQSCVGC